MEEVKQVEKGNDIYSTLLRATAKLSAVSFALSNDNSQLSDTDQWGLSYIVDDVKESLEAIAKDMEGGAHHD
ncbi:MAG: hypothetical protein H8D67_21485 [Deltaproteobacteria bacterium]|nr:hypothetical protein [Deltaproteobacteria bacterium]